MKRIAWLTAALAILVAAGVASAQAPPPPKPAEQEKPKPPAKKAKKVWTGDDLQDLKKPWDEHTEKKQKEADEAAKAEEATKAAAKEPAKEEPPAPEEIDPTTGKKILDPESLEAMEKDLASWEKEVKRTEQLAEDARKEMTAAPDQDAWESAKARMEIYEQNVVDMQQKIEELRAKIAEKKKTQTKPPAKAPGASPQS